MDKVALYLRKSRADEEIEKQYGEGETLAKHRNTLLKFAKDHQLSILKIYEEIVSGESLIHRPQMLELLKDIESGLFNAVLCMDVDRLGRGNMQEQGLILDTFKKSKTKIITLRKTYDLNDDFDEEYSEFEAFMSRKELKLINRRLQRGRVRSIEEGNYIGTMAPFGYMKKDLTLVPHPEQAHIVKLIFDMYVNKGLGSGTIAKELNSMSLKTYTGIDWTLNSVVTIIKNEIYAGKVIWKKKCITKSITPGKSKDAFTRPKNEWIIAQGKHEPLIDENTFIKAQDILKLKIHPPYHITNGIKNSLAGLIICKICGSKMHLRPYGNKDPHLVCDKNCGNKSSKYMYVEQRTIESISNWLSSYDLQLNNQTATKFDNSKVYLKNINLLEKEMHDLQKQKLKLHDFLEQGIYTVETFLERSKNISERIEVTQTSINMLNEKLINESSVMDERKAIEKVKYIIDCYKSAQDPKEKNLLLKSILEKAEYFKNKSQRNDNFTLVIFPKLPI